MKKNISLMNKLNPRLLLRKWKKQRRENAEFEEWQISEKVGQPPHIVKQIVLREYAHKYGLKVLVETGTYYGDMVEAMQNHFDHIYSIELHAPLYEQAVEKFCGADNVKIIHGDSGSEIKKIISQINKPILFWLDGHYSGAGTGKGKKETPIYEELNSILQLNMREHVIIIDDARLFGTDPAYPTIAELCEFVRAKVGNTVVVSIENDSIRITPQM